MTSKMQLASSNIMENVHYESDNNDNKEQEVSPVSGLEYNQSSEQQRSAAAPTGENMIPRQNRHGRAMMSQDATGSSRVSMLTNRISSMQQDAQDSALQTEDLRRHRSGL